MEALLGLKLFKNVGENPMKMGGEATVDVDESDLTMRHYLTSGWLWPSGVYLE